MIWIAKILFLQTFVYWSVPVIFFLWVSLNGVNCLVSGPCQSFCILNINIFQKTLFQNILCECSKQGSQNLKIEIKIKKLKLKSEHQCLSKTVYKLLLLLSIQMIVYWVTKSVFFMLFPAEKINFPLIWTRHCFITIKQNFFWKFFLRTQILMTRYLFTCFPL